MPFQNLKEEIITLYKNASSAVENSQWFHYFKEKYDHLNPKYKKILKTALAFGALAGLFYYPVQNIYSSQKNMKEFTDKKELTQELVKLSLSGSSSAPQQQNISSLKNFISRNIYKTGLNNKQIKDITSGKGLKNPLGNTSTVESVNITALDLNLKEIMNYGQKIEALARPLKMTGLHIIENEKKDNYFSAVYTISLLRFDKTGTDKPRIDKPRIDKKPTKAPIKKGSGNE